MSRTIATVLALSGAWLVATASPAPPRSYTAAATEACLTRRAGAIVGLPPATPPVPPALFVYPFPADRVPSQVRGKLGVWYGRERGRRYEGITLSFFKSVQRARASFKSVTWLYGGKRIRNVVIAWDQSSVPRRTLQKTVLNCLRAVAPADETPARKRPTPRARRATFVGYWGGHTRGLRLTPSGLGFERVYSGCCVHVITVAFRLLQVSGTVTHATATVRVTGVKRGDWTSRRPRVGQIGRLVLRNGIVTDTVTGIYYCSDPAWGATGACGA